VNAADREPPTVGSLAAAWPRELSGLALLAIDEVDSTQRLARTLVERQLAEDEIPPACCIVALEQTRGRGRRGRSWESAAGKGVWATLVVVVEPAALGALPLRSAVALAEALAGLAPEVRLKWPNDLMVVGRKLGGILIETILRDGVGAWAMIGFGVNLEHGDDDLPTAEAASLRSIGVAPASRRLERLAPQLAGALWREIELPSTDWLERYRARSVHRPGDRIECDLESERVTGELIGFEENGALRLRTPAGERSVVTGDLFRW